MSSFKHILFPFDFSAQGSQVASFVRAFAERLHAHVTLLGVVPPAFDATPVGLGPRIGDDPVVWKADLRAQLDHALIGAFDDVAVARAVEAGDPGLRIARFAEEHAVDLIMMPTHGLGVFRRLLLGSATSKVLHDATCPVWTAAHTETQRAGAAPKVVLCTVDGGASTPALLRWAATFSSEMGAALTVLHVVGRITDWPSLERERLLQDEVRHEARARIESMQREAGVDAPLHVALGDVVTTVSEYADRDETDLIVIGRGSVAEPLGRLRAHAFGIIQRASCPVVSV